MKTLKYLLAFVTWLILAGVLYNFGFRSPMIGMILGVVIVIVFGVGMPEKK